MTLYRVTLRSGLSFVCSEDDLLWIGSSPDVISCAEFQPYLDLSETERVLN